MMHTTFSWGKDVTILFDAWHVDTWRSYFITLLVIFLFSVFNVWLTTQGAANSVNQTREEDEFEHAIAVEANVHPILSFAERLAAKIGFSQKNGKALKFVVTTIISYFLMLIIMSFNVGVFLAIMTGQVVGFCIFRDNDNLDNSAPRPTGYLQMC